MKRIIISIVIILLLWLGEAQIFGADDQVIRIGIRTSVCGNGLIEGGEDCEGLDLGEQNCRGKGYNEGSLSCDIACSFIYSACVLWPTATPTVVVPSITPTLTVSEDPNIQSPSASPTAIYWRSKKIIPPTPTNFVEKERAEALVSISNLIVSKVLFSLDTDASGSLEEKELFQVVDKWVGSRRGKDKQNCDLNNDSNCDIVDFSILMYYIDRKM